MFFKKEILPISLLAALIYCIGCRPDNTFVPGSNGAARIDLFKDNPVQIVAGNSNLLSPNTALKYCAVAIAASGLQLADSSYNRTTRDNFYLYAAFTDSTVKGKPLKAGSKLYFTSYKKFKPAEGQYLLYLLPLANHTIIRSNLHIQFEWMPNAPFLINKMP